MKISTALLLISCFPVFGQIPISVNRSVVNSSASVALPHINSNTASQGGSTDGTYSNPSKTVGFSGSPITVNIASQNVTVPSSIVEHDQHEVDPFPISADIQVTLNPASPSAFTNTLSISVSYNVFNGSSGIGFTAGGSLSQDYIFTIIEDGVGGTSTNAILTGQIDSITSLSRNSTDTSQRTLAGFQLKASSTATLLGLAFTLSNTTTNGVNNFSNLQLVQDADGGEDFDLSDTVLATTTNANGFAIFSGLSIPLTTTNTTLFLSASFDPSRQTKNSFISASLKGQNISVVTTGTTVPISVSGASVAGKQYAFLDNTSAEDAAFAFSLTNGLGGVSINNSKKKIGFADTVLPATAAGVAGVGAAFTSDSLNEHPVSQEFAPRQPQTSSEFSPKY